MTTAKQKAPTEGIYRRLSKLLATAKDERGNAKVRVEALRLFDKLCKKFHIDPSCIRTDGYNLSDQFVLEVHTESKKFDAPLRTVCLLVGEIYDCQIRGREHASGKCILDFITVKPKRPDEAARSYQIIKAQMDAGWNRMQEAWMRDEAKERVRPTISSLFIGGGFRGRKPHKKSYVSGFYHMMKERLQREQSARKRFRHLIEEPDPVAPVALLPEPEPWLRPPPNPLALMVPIKVERCCPDGIPFIRCPACVAFDKYARRKVATVKRQMAKREDPPPAQPDEAPSDDPEYEAQRDDECDMPSYVAGQQWAERVELNEMKF